MSYQIQDETCKRNEAMPKKGFGKCHTMHVGWAAHKNDFADSECWMEVAHKNPNREKQSKYAMYESPSNVRNLLQQIEQLAQSLMYQNQTKIHAHNSKDLIY